MFNQFLKSIHEERMLLNRLIIVLREVINNKYVNLKQIDIFYYRDTAIEIIYYCNHAKRIRFFY